MKQKLQESHLDYIHKTKQFDELYDEHSRNLQVGLVVVRVVTIYGWLCSELTKVDCPFCICLGLVYPI